ncbi:SDR family NAD(P)-dependent oxidoreductase [Candidatus Gracilibacteria bacterium]|nr:SDR family NAD(P)-dependent oxidoreductase [Candidatus Gracilibacteria bacterium]NJM89503.1 SDR family NAD(P)-dependent oxidoreductase [Hydrococcus sp. RU_2_2]NJP19063.1 SDR family NAD(P)-dependent oxidoreductase [Hydrococcus sp. CRU_1_1]NJQ98623.1 SDR family NAD(P)-dependent oxidoreductase [Hydrococcus sp. CSU_1_8]
MNTQNKKVWLITGSSTGFGRILAEQLLEKGEIVVATARKPEQLQDLVARYRDRALAVQLDVTNPSQVRESVNKAIATFGPIDVLVNNAGYGTMGAIEEVSDEIVRQQYETNVFGAIDVMRAVLPQMRQQRSGYILNLSSVGGMVSFPGAGIYCSTKFALEGISEALAKEVAPLGIKVIIVEPGAFRTDFNGRSLVMADTQIADYEEVIGGFRQWLKDMDGKQPGDPAKAALAMIQAVESENPPLRLALGVDAISAIEAKLDTVKTELNAWREVGTNTTYEGVTVGAIGG